MYLCLCHEKRHRLLQLRRLRTVWILTLRMDPYYCFIISIARNKAMFAFLNYRRGNEAFKAGRFSVAIGCYEEAIKQDPSNTRAYLNRSMSYFHLGSWKDCVGDANKVSYLLLATNSEPIIGLPRISSLDVHHLYH